MALPPDGRSKERVAGSAMEPSRLGPAHPQSAGNQVGGGTDPFSEQTGHRDLAGDTQTEGNPYILPGKKEGRPLVNISKAWGRIRKAAKIEDVRIHDLRRTVGSWLSSDSVDLNQIKEALRHASISTTLTYARLGADPARKAMESHGKKVMKMAGNVRPVNGDGI